MNENKFDLNRPFESDRGIIRVGFDRVVTAGAVVIALSMIGNANTELGLNPINYPMALWFYIER